jgi:hypothetical protein
MARTLSNLRYRSFDQLMASIERDLYTFADEGYFVRSKFIKEARRVNADLGLRINSEREEVLDVVDHTALLPPDFQFLQLAVSCHVGHFSAPAFEGAHTEAHTIDIPLENRSCNFGVCNTSNCGGPCNNCMWVTQRIGLKSYTYTDIRPLTLTKGSSPFTGDFCINHHFGHAKDQMGVSEDHATFSFREGKVFINYLADMVDEDHNILILDHPLVNDYYEYAIKKKFFEMMKVNKEGDFLQDYQIMAEELRKARIQAISFVNTPEYGELIKIFTDNRHRFYRKYVDYFNDPNVGFYSHEPRSLTRRWDVKYL